MNVGWELYVSKCKWKSLSHDPLCNPMDHGLHSPWNSPGRNTGVGSLSLLQGVFPTQGPKPGVPIAGGFFTSWATRKAQECWSGQPFPSPANLPDLGIKLRSPALQVDSLPTELSGNTTFHSIFLWTYNYWKKKLSIKRNIRMRKILEMQTMIFPYSCS